MNIAHSTLFSNMDVSPDVREYWSVQDSTDLEEACIIVICCDADPYAFSDGWAHLARKAGPKELKALARMTNDQIEALVSDVDMQYVTLKQAA